MKSVKDRTVGSCRKYKWQFLLSCVALFVSLFSLSAQDYPDKPSPPRLVNDFAGMMNSDEVDALEEKLVNYNDSTSTQISIVTVYSLEGMDIAQYATELGEKWGIGRKDRDNGVLILAAKEDRKVFIATGRGVEEYLPDAICKRIVTNRIIPRFKEGNFYAGLSDAVTEMHARLSGTFVNDENDDDRKGIPIWVIILIVFILFFILPLIFGRGRRGTTYSRGGHRSWGGGPFWIGGGGFGGGGGSFSGGGGFGGFGGGSFGGGGAGGSW